MDRAAGELKALTGLRGVAAWAVVVFHLRGSLSLPAPALALADRFNLAVDLFFALSGFVIWHAWRARLAAGAPGTAAAFLLRRLARLWPLHAAVLGAVALLALALAASGRAHPDQPWPLLPLHLALAGGWGFADRLAWNDPDWSVSCEWAAYLLTPLLAATIDWRRVRTPALVLALAALPFVLAAAMHALGAASIGELIPRTGLVRCLVDYLAGTILSELWRRAQAGGHAGLGAAAALAAIAGAARWLSPIAAADAFVLLLLLGTALSCGRRWNPLDRTAAVTLGRWSYATYLFHYPLWTVAKLLFVADPARPGAAVLAGYGVTLLALSRLLHRRVELPAQAWANARVARLAETRRGRSVNRRRTPPAASR